MSWKLYPSEGYYKVTYNGDKMQCCKSIRKVLKLGIKDSMDVARQMVCGNGENIELTREELVCDWLHTDENFEFDLIKSYEYDMSGVSNGACVVIDMCYEQLGTRDKAILERISELKNNLSRPAKKWLANMPKGD